MNGSKLLWTLAILLVGGSMLGGCNHPRPQTILIVVEGGGKIFPFAKKGDVLQWKDPKLAKFPVTFYDEIGSPCTESTTKPSTPLDTCTVDTAGVFPYHCDGCEDPGVHVGSDVLGEQTGLNAAPRTSVKRSIDNYLYCDKDVPKALYPTITASAGDKVEWFPGPKSGIVNWQVTLQPNTCVESTINQGQKVCKVQPQAKTQLYSITADFCAGPGSAVLTIQ